MECPLPLACFQFWLKGPVCLQFHKNDKRREGEKRQKRESGGNWKKVLAVVIAHLHPLAPICSSKLCTTGLCHHHALPFLAVLPLLSSPVFLCKVGGSGVTAWLWRRYLSLAWTCACLPAQLSRCSLLLVEAWHFTTAQMDQMHGQETRPWCSMEVRENLSKYILKSGILGYKGCIDPVAMFLNQKRIP